LENVCSNLILDIIENKNNDSPQINKKNNINGFYNLDKSQYTYEFKKNRNNKIESQCLLEFLNFIDHNVKNTITSQNEAIRIYSKYEFLTNNIIDNKFFFDLINLKNFDIKDFDKFNKTENFDLLLNLNENEDNKIDLGKPYEYNENLNEEHNLDKIENLKDNKNMNIKTNSEKSFEENEKKKLELFKENINTNFNLFNGKNKNKNKLNLICKNNNNCNNGNINNNTFNYTLNNYKTSINSQDIDIINELQLNKNLYQNHSIKNSTKIFKSSNTLSSPKIIQRKESYEIDPKNEFFEGILINKNKNFLIIKLNY